jgi:GNAT superfamily N-acetyltransferase/DNA-binding MarR family transcriptional regulator
MDREQVEQVRRFNRFLTQRVGALEDSYLRRGRPLGEARLLFEVGSQGADVRALRTRLALDSGYLSRLLRSLEAQGLIHIEKQVSDGRARSVKLTAKGRYESIAYNKLSDGLAKSILEPLNETQRKALVGAMAEVERLAGRSAIQVGVEAPGSKDAHSCLRRYFQELSKRFDGGFNPAKSNPARDGEMTPPAGYFVVARLDGHPVGCGALKIGDGGAGEIKRMWTKPSARGQGIARAILQKLEATARQVGLKVLRLETNQSLKEAQALYRKEGYREVAPFNREPYAHHWFEKRL